MLLALVNAAVCLFLSVAHHIYGVAHTINCANYVYFRGLQKALTLNHPDVTQVFTGALFTTLLLLECFVVFLDSDKVNTALHLMNIITTC